MQRYWELKKDVMDSVLFYRFGDWYVLYYKDLEIANKNLSICVTPHIGSGQMGFPSRDLDKNVRLLTDLGFKVAVAEQQETIDDMKNRFKKTKKNESDLSDSEEE